ncbi:MAG: hypothetical protein K8823_599 [Cenarchaeum symbiont of Oopsacas minuta]|nr:hypothetical protein [Cenarchaeum symbiont of Oopsacas minuta]
MLKHDVESLDRRCKKIQQLDMIRFAGVINKDGDVIAGGFKSGVKPFEDDKLRLRKFFRFATLESIGKEYDENLGSMNYLAARRDKLIFISFPFPISDIILLISAEPKAEIEKLATVASNVFAGIK